METEIVEEMFEVIDDEGEGLYTAEENAANESFLNESSEEIQAEALDDFSEEVVELDPPPSDPPPPAQPPNKFLTWLKSIKGTTWANMGFQAVMIGIMLYPLIKGGIKSAQASGNRIKLSAAIDGAKATLETDYDKTIKGPAQAIKDNAELWKKLTPEHQREIEESIALTGADFWTLNGADIMKAYALMPIYDPTV